MEGTRKNNLYTGKTIQGYVSFTCTMRICQDPTQLGEDFFTSMKLSLLLSLDCSIKINCSLILRLDNEIFFSTNQKTKEKYIFVFMSTSLQIFL